MTFSYELIKEITCGIAGIEQKDGFVIFHRFTAEQEEYYAKNKPDLYAKTFATAGVKMRFITDGTAINIKFDVEKASSRTFFAVDVFANGEYIGSADNYSDITLDIEYPKQVFKLGGFEKTFALGGGEKEVSVYFPWSAAMRIREISAENATFVRAVKPKKKILVFGDSITQGYDALHPHKRYAARLADALNAEEINKAIGAEVFVPELAEISEDFCPDYISVAYGTNDWSKTGFSGFQSRCEKFFRILARKYPKSRIFALTPVWRKDYAQSRQGWDFSEVEKTIYEIAEKYENITPLRGFGFIPQSEKYFSDLYLHPNDDGFNEYADSLISEIKKLNS